VTSQDVAAIFISAHGETDGRGDLYIIANDTDVTDQVSLQQSGVEWSDLQKIVEDVGGAGKALVFIDACKSGQVLQNKRSLPPDIDKAVAELRGSGNNITVFSSSTGTQLSVEDPKLGHGYFTYALLEALDGKAPRVGSYLTAGDINRYLAGRVKELTSGSQTPIVTTPRGATTNPPLFLVQ